VKRWLPVSEPALWLAALSRSKGSARVSQQALPLLTLREAWLAAAVLSRARLRLSSAQA
jgi:hypothetical protein